MLRMVLIGAVSALVAGMAAAAPPGPAIRLLAPLEGQLSLVGPVEIELELPPRTRADSVVIRIDGSVWAPSAAFEARGARLRIEGVLDGLGAGRHTLDVEVRDRHGSESLSSWFELVELEDPEHCEVLNNAACLLPFPSARFLERAPTRTGLRVVYPPEAMPFSNRLDVPLAIPPVVNDTRRADPTPYLQNDGFSPTVQILMNFPAGVDLNASGAPRVERETRTFGTRGLEASSPTLLLDRRGARRINHWTENDSNTSDTTRRVTFLRPGEALLPGHRYVVAVRNLVDPDGLPVEAEPVFAAIRDGRPSDIPAVERTRRRLEPLLRWLAAHGVAREELVLAFDFVVSSDHSLTHEMLSMRDQAFAWLAEQVAAGVQTFTVDEVRPHNESCDPAGSPTWREIRGRFQAPLFLDGDPFTAAQVPSFLQRDARGRPVFRTLTLAPYAVAIPCTAWDAPQPALLLGHGLFGTGAGFVRDLAEAEVEDFSFVTGGTNWSGLSSPDAGPNLLDSFIVRIIADVDQFEALPDRLRQGQLHALLLARMLKQGVFHVDPSFRVDGRGVIDTETTAYYFGVSLGGIMGTMFAALTPDVEKLNVDVPGINFSLLLQRAKPFKQFQLLVDFVTADPMEQVIGYGLNHELWVRGEPAGYANHVTGAPLRPLPGAIPKRMLVTVAWLDQQVSNLASQVLGRTLRLGTLEGSLMRGLPGMPDTRGPQESAYVVYDTGSYDLENPDHRRFIPPLGNRPALVDDNRCDPHNQRGLIPASQEQLRSFLTPDGAVENFCADGVCDASEPNEIPLGAALPCNPLE